MVEHKKHKAMGFSSVKAKQKTKKKQQKKIFAECAILESETKNHQQ